MMIADFNKRTGIAVSEAGMWNVRAQYHEASRGSFVERELTVLHIRHPAEWVAGEVLGSARSSRRHRHEPIGRAFFFQGHQDRSAEGAAGDAVNDKLVHVNTP